MKYSLPYFIYLVISTILITFLYPFILLYALLKGIQDRFKQRFGIYPQPTSQNLSGNPIIWIHAVSVGEVNVARAIINPLKKKLPNCSILLSTTTFKGFDMAQSLVCNRVQCIYAPIDYILSVQKALKLFKPDILVLLETEIWPNWIMTCKQMGIKTVLINGRISTRSINRYLKFKPFLKPILAQMDAFSMITQHDSKRIMLLGAANNRIVVHPNAKFDLLTHELDSKCQEILMKRFNLFNNDIVLVAGSTRTGEDEIILDAFDHIHSIFPNAVLIIAPRHVNRSDKIVSIVKHRCLSCGLYHQYKYENKKRTETVIIVDTIGDLAQIYSIATFVFCGASLVPLGGQNLLEAAIWGKPIFHGPYMDDFIEARDLLFNASASIPVNDSKDFIQKIIYYSHHLDEAKQIGKKAKQAILSRSGAAMHHADEIIRVLNHSSQV